MAITHAKVSTHPDPSDTSLVGKTDWNAAHVGSLPAGSVAHSDLTGLTSGDDHTQYQKESEKDAVNGYPGLSGAGFILASKIPVFVASGASHAPGGVPDPGASGGTTKFLREDASWAVPPGTGGGIAGDTIWDTKGDLAVATAADTASKLAAGADGKVLTTDSAQATGLKWATPSSGNPWTEIIKSADQTRTNDAVLFSDTELTFAMDATSGYLVQFFILYSANNVTGKYAWGILFSAAASVDGWYSQLSSGGGNTLQGADDSVAAGHQWPFDTIITAGSDGTDANIRGIQIPLVVYNRAAGTNTVTWQFANSAAAGGRTSTTRAKSMLRYRKLA